LRGAFTQKFINTDLKKHREEVLFQKEKALLPLRQPIAERMVAIRELEQEFEEYQAQIRQLTSLAEDVRMRIIDLRYGNHTKEPKRTFIRPCPYDNCRGFLSQQWKCGVCTMWTCKDCHEVKGPHQDCQHTCDPDKVKSAELIEKETRPCPKCGVRLFRISGCNQMWCTHCNDCAFDWVTGRIEGTIHNPHFFEYQRTRSAAAEVREQDRYACEIFEINQMTPEQINSNVSELASRIEIVKPAALKMRQRQLINICQMHLHITHVVMPKYNVNHITLNEELAVKFILNEITEQEFKIKLQRTDKRAEMCREITNVFQMVTETLRQIVMRYATELSRYKYVDFNVSADKPRSDIFKILDESRELISYGNECLKKIGEIYSAKTPILEDISV
jgi:hypothetical protein